MLIVTGTFRVPPGALPGFRPHMAAMIAASRAEPGCLQYSYAEDVLEPGLIHVAERWTDRAALDLHGASPHIAAWRASWAEFGAGERSLRVYEADAGMPL